MGLLRKMIKLLTLSGATYVAAKYVVEDKKKKEKLDEFLVPSQKELDEKETR